MSVKLLGLLCCIWALAGCATVDRPPCVSLGAQVQYCLQSPAAVGVFNASQRVDVSWNQKQETTLAELESDGTSFTMAALTPMGQSLMQFRYTPPSAELLSGVTSRIDPALMVALVQLALWPSDSVAAGLRGDFNWSADSQHRRLETGGTVLLDITFEGQLPRPQRLQLRLPAQRLELDIHNLEQEGTLP